MHNTLKFYSEITSIHFQKKEEKDGLTVLSLNHYLDEENNYFFELMHLAEKALTEILFLNKENINFHFKRLLHLYLYRHVHAEDLLDVTSEDIKENTFEISIFIHVIISAYISNINVRDADSFYVEDEELFVKAFSSAYEAKSWCTKNLIIQLHKITGIQLQLDDNDISRYGEFDYWSDDVFDQLIKGHKPLFEEKETLRKSYKWLKGEKTLKLLYDLLNGVFIDEVDYAIFKLVFSEEVVGKEDRLKWKSGSASELLYFISRLEGYNIIEKKSKRADYIKLRKCFCKPDGSEFNEALKVLNQGLETNVSSSTQDELEGILNKIL